MPPKAVCSTAVEFKEIGFAQSGENKIGFWEVVTPAGFVSTGDCLSTGDLPPCTRACSARTNQSFSRLHRSSGLCHLRLRRVPTMYILEACRARWLRKRGVRRDDR